jgi:hypothetical protein
MACCGSTSLQNPVSWIYVHVCYRPQNLLHVNINKITHICTKAVLAGLKPQLLNVKNVRVQVPWMLRYLNENSMCTSSIYTCMSDIEKVLKIQICSMVFEIFFGNNLCLWTNGPGESSIYPPTLLRGYN